MIEIVNVRADHEAYFKEPAIIAWFSDVSVFFWRDPERKQDKVHIWLEMEYPAAGEGFTSETPMPEGKRKFVLCEDCWNRHESGSSQKFCSPITKRHIDFNIRCKTYRPLTIEEINICVVQMMRELFGRTFVQIFNFDVPDPEAIAEIEAGKVTCCDQMVNDNFELMFTEEFIQGMVKLNGGPLEIPEGIKVLKALE